MPTESFPNFSLSLSLVSSVFSGDPPFSGLSSSVTGAEAPSALADRKWHGRGEALSARGAGTGTVPHGLRLPLPPPFLFFFPFLPPSPSRVQMHIHLL